MTQLTKTPKQKVEKLKLFLKSTRSPNEKDRARAILKLIEGRSRFEVAGFLDINVKTLDTWQRAFKKKGVNGLRSAPQTGNNNKLSLKKKKSVKKTINSKTPEELGLKGKFWTVPLLKQYVKKKYGIAYKSPVSYQRLFKYCGFTFHKPEKVNRRRNDHMRRRFEVDLKKSSNGTSQKAVWYW